MTTTVPPIASRRYRCVRCVEVEEAIWRQYAAISVGSDEGGGTRDRAVRRARLAADPDGRAHPEAPDRTDDRRAGLRGQTRRRVSDVEPVHRRGGGTRDSGPRGDDGTGGRR